jgi:hypothetical protein
METGSLGTTGAACFQTFESGFCGAVAAGQRKRLFYRHEPHTAASLQVGVHILLADALTAAGAEAGGPGAGAPVRSRRGCARDVR